LKAKEEYLEALAKYEQTDDHKVYMRTKTWMAYGNCRSVVRVSNRVMAGLSAILDGFQVEAAGRRSSSWHTQKTAKNRFT
jgi:hypothetical protein